MSETSVVGALAYLPEDFDAVIAAMAEGRYATDGWVAEIAPDQLVHTFGELRQGRGTRCSCGCSAPRQPAGPARGLLLSRVAAG